MKHNEGLLREEGHLSRPQWVSEVTSDAVRHFAWGIGDNNPLWVDPDYGLASVWETTLAPPSFAYAIDETTVAPGMPDYERHYERVEWEWFHQFELGDRVTSETKFLDEEHDQRADVTRQRGEIFFRSADKGLVARAIVTTRRDRIPLKRIDDRDEIRYDPEELSQIEEDILSEKIRGAISRHPGDVAEGDGVGTITKGPISIMDIVAWCAGTTGSPDDPQGFASGGLDDQAATGPQLASWVVHLLTNWMGDSGVLHTLTVNFSGLPLLGSTTTIGGTITRKFSHGNDQFCEIDVECRLQNDEIIARGRAVVQLPTNTADEN
ncbi:MAG: MaoC family dehydratase N-terminal domain-containing protein [Actinomycetota bacterium]|nr:MaoC family dehydratase N-terminal domain-containing protein [Actinomycetota bacterium]